MANEVNGNVPVTPAPAGPAPAPAVPQPPAPAPAGSQPLQGQPVHPSAQPYGVRPAVIHQEKSFYQKVWFWIVLGVAVFVLSTLGTVCGTYLYRAMSGTTNPGAYRMMNGGQMPNFNNGSGSGTNRYYNNGGGNGNSNGNSGSGSGSSGNNVTQ
ncbi:MAG: hypothetical protein FWF45_04845 [Coriobacteriia bacterium]|nr:hypothetical protein [Coriobacteriia bacterium]